MRHIRWGCAVAGMLIASAALAQNFDSYAVPVFAGRTASPNFNGPGAEFRYMRTAVARGFARGANFAGHYTLIKEGCGAGCLFVLVGDLKTGRISHFPVSGSSYYMLSLTHRANSRLVLARWTTGNNIYRCYSQQYVLTDGSFHKVGRETVARRRCPGV
jgi:hypothetical protein